MYKAVVLFTDLQDNNHEYPVGATYPREGYTPTQERIESLLSVKNRRGIPVIEAIEFMNPPEDAQDSEPVEVTEEMPVKAKKGGRPKKKG